MAGSIHLRMLSEPALKLTPGRRTFVVYRAFTPQLVCPALGHQRDYASLTETDTSGLVDTVIREGSGIELSLDEKEHGVSTLTGDAGYLAGAVAGGYLGRNVNRSYPEVTGSGGGSSLAAFSGPMYERQIGAGESVLDAKFRLESDALAFPGPGTAEEGIALDRVFVAEVASDSTSTEYVWMVEPVVHNRVGTIPLIRAYVTGPASYIEKEWTGYGQYAVVGFSDGSCKIYERGLDQLANEARWRDWRPFHAAQAAESGARNTRWAMRINTPHTLTPTGGFIRIKWGSLNDKRPSAGGILAAAPITMGPMLVRLNDGHLFRPPRRGSFVPPTLSAPLRADVPRPFKTNFAVRKASWRTSGYVRDRRFHFPAPHWGNLIRAEIYGNFPSGTDAMIRLFRDDGTEVSATTSGTIGAKGRFAEFEPGDESTFFPEIHLSGPGTATPVIHIVKVLRNGTVSPNTDYSPELAVKPVTRAGGRVSIATGGSDPTTDSFGWSHVALDSAIDSVLPAGFFTFRIETEFPGYEPGDRRCVLGGGICEHKPRRRRRVRGKRGFASKGTDHPKPVTYEVDFTGGPITFLGSIQRTLIPDFGIDPSGPGAGQPRKATEAIRHLLNIGGWPMDMIDIAPNDVRLYTEDSSGFELDFNADFIDVAVQIAKDYLGGALIFDWNAGSAGKWKLIVPPSAPYTNQAIFTTAKAPEGKAFSLTSYPTVSGVPTCPIVELTIQDMRPQANFITVIGGADRNGRVIRQEWRNTNSFPVHPDQDIDEASLAHPDWVGFQIPLWKRNAAIQSQEQADWMCARLAQQLGHAYKLIHVEAPLVLIPHEDDGTRRRPLRFGDPVQVLDGEVSYQCLVRSMSIGYEKDSRQMAVYELETVRDA